MSDSTNDGTARGMIEFFNGYLVDKGYAAAGAVSPLVSASRAVLSAMEGDAWESTDIRQIDLDDYLSRFEIKKRSDYKAESLAAYRTRFTKAVMAYRQWITDGSRPTFGAPRGNAKPRTTNDGSGRNNEQQKVPPPAGLRSTELVAYPFPLTDGTLAELRLPARLPKAEAKRIAAFVEALAIDPVLQITTGDDAI